MQRGRSKPHAPGLKHIANELGVSLSLVSKVLSGRMGTSGAQSATIAAIQEKAEALNYRKNSSAEALRSGRHNTIAVYVHRHGVGGSAIIEEMVAGISGEATNRRQRLSLCFFETVEEFRTLCSDAHRNSVDGLIVAGLIHAEMSADLAKICRDGLPVVTVHDQQLDPLLPNIGMDQVEVGRLATLHVIDQGCRHVAHFAVVDAPGSIQSMRFAGYKKALAERGLRYDARRVIEVDTFTHHAGDFAARKLLDSGVPFDALVAQSDQQAAAALNLFVTRGIKVPGEIKVTGVDDSPYCDFTIVPLTSVSQQFHQRGGEAMKAVLAWVAGEKVASVSIRPLLTVRPSTVPSVPAA